MGHQVELIVFVWNLCMRFCTLEIRYSGLCESVAPCFCCEKELRKKKNLKRRRWGETWEWEELDVVGLGEGIPN